MIHEQHLSNETYCHTCARCIKLVEGAYDYAQGRRMNIVRVSYVYSHGQKFRNTI